MSDAYTVICGLDLELGRTLAKHLENRRKMVFEISKHLVVKIVCVKPAADGILRTRAFFNGFYYHEAEPLIITVGHIDGFAGATRYFAMFPDGTHRELIIKKSGQPIGECRTRDDIPFWGHNPDVAIMEYIQPPAHNSYARAATACVGDTVFVIGFKGCEDAQLVFSEGTVSTSVIDGMTITGYADNGFSGSPIFNADGFVVGMVMGGEGHTILQVNVVPALTIQQLLQSSEAPGPLPGLSG